MSSHDDRAHARRLASDIDDLKKQVTSAIVKLDALTKLAAEADAASYSIKRFCARNDLSESQYFKLRRAGRGPRVMSTGSAGVRISREAEREWVRDREREAAASTTPGATAAA